MDPANTWQSLYCVWPGSEQCKYLAVTLQMPGSPWILCCPCTVPCKSLAVPRLCTVWHCNLQIHGSNRTVCGLALDTQNTWQSLCAVWQWTLQIYCSHLTVCYLELDTANTWQSLDCVLPGTGHCKYLTVTGLCAASTGY